MAYLMSFSRNDGLLRIVTWNTWLCVSLLAGAAEATVTNMAPSKSLSI